MKRNTFSKALKHLKSTELDEKIQRLNEAPTNSMSGVYSLNDPGFRLGGVDEYDPEKVFYPDVDGNWPAEIPGTPGADTYTRPAGFWSGGTDWDTIHVSDLSQAYLDVDATGTSTSSLIESDGTVKTPLPPNSRHFILGPLVDGYVPNHGYDDYTNIGYLQKDTRQFVLLASIPGHWDSNLRPSGFTPRQWDGNTITIYNANFTLAMADWFSDKITSDNYTENVPYFYSGGVPQLPQSPANCPKCPPNMKGGNGAGGAGAGWGSGGNSGQGSKQGNPKKGGPGDANLWGLNSKTGKKEKLSAKDYAAYKAGGGDAAAKKGKSIEDIIAQGQKNLGQDKSPSLIDILKNVPNIVRDAVVAGTKVIKGIATNIAYAGDYMFKGLQATTTEYIPTYTGGSPFKIGNYNVPKLADIHPIITKVVQRVVGDNYFMQYFGVDTKTAKEYAGPGGSIVVAQRPASNAPSIKNPAGLPVSTSIYGQPEIQTSALGGGTPALEIIKMDDPNLEAKLSKYSQPVNASAKNLSKSLAVAGGAVAVADSVDRYNRGDTTGGGIALLSAIPGTVGVYANAALMLYDYYNLIQKGVQVTKGSPERTQDIEKYKQMMPKYGVSSVKAAQKASGIKEHILIEESNIDILSVLNKNGLPTDFYELMKMLMAYMIVNGFEPNFVNIVGRIVGGDLSKKEMQYLQNDFPQLILGMESLIKSNKNQVKESIIISESHQKILREIKQPVKVEEPKVQKLKKYRPNFAGKYTPQNTPDVTASSQSDELVKAKNAAGQTWRTKDKHWSRYESTERMNIIFDNVGHGSQYWDQIVDKNQLKKVVRDREVQEHLNIIAHEKAMLREDPFYESPFRKEIQEQETLQADKDPLFKKVKDRLKTVIDYPDKPSKLGYPDAPPPEMMNGFHPEYGQKADYYNALDPHSANAMPSTGNPEIDAKVRRAKTLKRVLGKKS